MKGAFALVGVLRGAPSDVAVADRAVRVHDAGGELLAEGRTDQKGRVRLRLPGARRDRLVVAVANESGRAVHVAAVPVRWAGEEARFDLAVPDEKLGAPAGPRVTLLDGHGEPLEELEIGDSLVVRASGLAPERVHAFRVVDEDGRAVVAASFVADREGVVDRAVLWPDVGLGGGRKSGRYSFATSAAALKGLGGRTFVVEVAGDDGRGTARSEVTISGELRATRLFASTRRGELRRGLLEGKDDLWVTARNVPGELLDVHVVPRRYGWSAGDAFGPARTARGDEVTARVKVGHDGEVTTRLARAGELPPGSYDLVARPVREHEFRAGDRVLRHTDLLSDRLLTGLVVRRDVWAYKPVMGGCVMALHELAGKRLPSAPYFEFVNTFPRGTDVWAALDPAGLMPEMAGRKVRLSVVPERSATDWGTNRAAADVNGNVVELVVHGSCVNGNMALVWPNPQQPGKYDLVVDFGNNSPDPAAFVADGSFDPPLDMIDGYFTVGFHVVDDPSLPGPFAVGRTSYSDPAVTIPATGVWWYGDVEGETPSGTLSLPLVADVAYPADAAGVDVPVSAARPSYPVVVIMHGMSWATSSYRGYGYLLDQLASHGFVAVSIDCSVINTTVGGGGMQDTRAWAMLEHLSTLQARNGAPGLLQGKLDMSRIVVAGHSRGGDGAVQAELYNQAYGLGWPIRGVVAVAPTDFSGMSPSPMALATAPYLCVFGSNDRDIGSLWGIPRGTGGTGTGFRCYDRATVEKTMAFVMGASHNPFNTEWGTEWGGVSSPRILPETTQRAVLAGYMTAFAQVHLQGRTEQRDFLNGELRPAAGTGAAVHVQYQPPVRRTVDHFEGASTPTVNTLGGAVSVSSVPGGNPVDDVIDLDWLSPHQTRGTRIRWSSSAARYESRLPAGQRNLSTYRFLSFRMAQLNRSLFATDDRKDPMLGAASPRFSTELTAGTVSAELRQRFLDEAKVAVPAGASASTLAPGSRWLVSDAAGGGYYEGTLDAGVLVFRRSGPGGVPYNPPDAAQDLYVRLSSGGGVSRAVRAGYFGTIPPPWVPPYPDLNWVLEETSWAALTTVRIPLRAFTIVCLGIPSVDLADVQSVAFELTATPRGELIVDDVELTAT